MMRLLLLPLLALFLISAPAQAQLTESADGTIIGQAIVQLQPQADLQALVLRANRLQPSSVKPLRAVASTLNIHLLEFDPLRWPGRSFFDWLDEQWAVASHQPNAQLEFRNRPNDPDYEFQWGAERIGLPDVWSATQGGLTALGDTIVVAILDSGFDPEHEDLAGNIWTNRGEIPNDSIDNDGNGYVDDYQGWDFKSNSPELAYGNHGLAVSGIIGAKGNNNLGVAGINWNVKMMMLSIGRVDHVISAYEYIIEQRRRYNETQGQEGDFIVVTNASWGVSGEPTFCDDEPLWNDMFDRLGEVGILTGAATANQNRDVDEVGDIPTSCSSPFIISVLNSNSDNQKHSNSAYGKKSIAMAAPGHQSYSLALNNSYGTFGDNSAAAPHLTGAIALLYSLDCEFLAAEALSKPSETALFIRSALFDAVEPLPAFKDITATGGRLHVRDAMNLIAEQCGGTTGPLELMTIFPNPARTEINILYETPDLELVDFRIYNALGQLVYRDTDRPNGFGDKILEVNVGSWQSGWYVAEIIRDGQMERKPFMVSRGR